MMEQQIPENFHVIRLHLAEQVMQGVCNWILFVEQDSRPQKRLQGRKSASFVANRRPNKCDQILQTTPTVGLGIFADPAGRRNFTRSPTSFTFHVLLEVGRWMFNGVG
jgi:hypothetical protein